MIPGRGALAVARGVAVVAMTSALVCWPGAARSDTRQQALARVQGYVEATYDVESRHVYPARSCYRNSGTLGAHLVPGFYEGVVYEFGGDVSLPSFTFDMFAGKGAGAYKDLFIYYGSDPNHPCLRDSITGLDCSAFVSRAWGLPRLGTCGLNDPKYSLPVAAQADVKPGDALNICGAHVILCTSAVSADGRIDTWEATGSGGRCRRLLGTLYTDLIRKGYKPRVAKKLKDDPAATVVGFEAIPSGGAVSVHWTTLIEDRTLAFSVVRSPSPDGPFEAVGTQLEARGNSKAGADYELIDPDAGSSDWFYGLIEVETNGRQLSHGTVSTREMREALVLERKR